jgi:D-glycero-D-manno-heptose 1,7-bisphosphate phosphatase
MTTLILLDRDGVINFDSADYVKTPAEWQPIPGSLEAIGALCAADLKVGLCTNQAGIARGLMSLSDLTEIHTKMDRALRTLGARLDAVAFCPHHPDEGCECRKPKPGMLLKLMRELSTKAENTIFIGDSLKDLEAAQAAGCRAVLVRTGNGLDTERTAKTQGLEVEVFDDLAGFVRELLR